jgi:hypothetical protein
VATFDGARKVLVHDLSVLYQRLGSEVKHFQICSNLNDFSFLELLTVRITIFFRELTAAVKNYAKVDVEMQSAV